MAALILGLTVFVGIPMIVGRFSTAVVSTGSSSPSVPLAPVPSGNGTLDVIVRLEPLSEPSGIVIAPAALANAHFQARLSTADGQLVATWPVTRGVTSRQTYAPGVYRLTVWRYIVMDQGETGARVTGPPEDECAIDLTLDASQSTSIVASFPWSTGACSFTISQ